MQLGCTRENRTDREEYEDLSDSTPRGFWGNLSLGAGLPRLRITSIIDHWLFNCQMVENIL